MKRAWPVILAKDLKVALSNPLIFLPMLIVPLVFTIVLPTVMLISAKYETMSMQGLDLMLKHVVFPAWVTTEPQKIVFTAIHYMFPTLFLMIPIMSASVLGASAFVSEKENRTLETLLYAPIGIRDIFLAKVLGTFIPAMLVTFLAFICFGTVVNIGGWAYFQKLIFPDLRWMILILLVSPAVTLFALTFIIHISAKVQTFQEAQQIVGIIVLPILLILVGQMVGLFMLTAKVLTAAGLVLLLIDLLFIRKVSSTFKPESLLR